MLEKEECEQELANKINVNDQYEVAFASQPLKSGTVMFKGEVYFKLGVWIGI